MNGAPAKYVYGVTSSSSDPPAEAGIGGAVLELIASHGLAALVSDVIGDELRMGREEIATHSRVLERALALGTVLPMRFGVVIADASAVRGQLLDAHREELVAQLAQLEGKVELTVRATYEEDALIREVVSEDPDVRQLQGSLRGAPEDATYYPRIQLGELVARAVERKRQRDAGGILDTLAPLALDVRVAEPAHERIAFSASFLVDRNRIADFDAVVESVAAAEANRLRFKYIGPLPPHSFVELATTA